MPLTKSGTQPDISRKGLNIATFYVFKKMNMGRIERFCAKDLTPGVAMALAKCRRTRLILQNEQKGPLNITSLKSMVDVFREPCEITNGNSWNAAATFLDQER